MFILRAFMLLLTPFLAYILPSSVKRMLVITSLYGKLVRKRKVNLATLQKLNNTLNLLHGNRPEALLVPLSLQRLIWGDAEISLKDLELNIRQDRYIDRIIALIPDSLRYGYERNDILILLKSLDSIPS